MPDGGFVGAGWVQISPSFAGFQQAVSKEMSSILGNVGGQAGKQLADGVARATAGGRNVIPSKGMEAEAGSVGSSIASRIGGSLKNISTAGLSAVGRALTAVGKEGAIGLGLLTTAVTTYSVANTQTYVKAQQFEQALSLVGKQLGISNEQIQGQISGMKGLGASTQTARDTVMTFMRSRMDLSRATELYSRAEDIAVATGKSGNEVQSQLIHGIETLNPLVLRNAGVTVDANTAYDKYAATIGKTRGELTQTEKQQAFMNAVMENSSAVAGIANKMLTEGVFNWSALRAPMSDVAETAGSLLEPAMSAVGRSLYGLVREFVSATSEGGKLHPIIDAIRKVFAQLGEPIARVIDRVKEWIQGLQAPQIKRFADSIKELAPIILAAGSALSVFAGQNVARNIPILGQFLGKLDPLKAGFVGLLLTMPETRSALLGLLQAFTPLIKPLTTIAQLLSGVLQRALKDISPLIKTLAEILGEIVRFSPELATLALAATLVAGNMNKVKGAFDLLHKHPLLAAIAAGALVFTTLKKALGPIPAAILAIAAGFIVLNIAMGPINLILIAIIAAVAAIAAAIYFLVKNWEKVWNAIKDAISWVWNNVLKRIFNAIMGIINKVVDAFKGLWHGIENAFKAVWSFLSGLPGRIAGFFANAWNWLWDKGKQIVQGLIKGIQEWAGNIVKGAQVIWDKISGFFSGLWNKIWDIGKRIVMGIWQGLKDWASNIVKGCQVIWGLISRFFSGLWNKIWDIGKSIVSAIWKGIQDWAGNIVKGCQVIWGLISGFFSNLWNKIWAIGKTIVMGIWRGIQDWAGNIVKGCEVIWEKVSGFFSGLWNKIWDIGKGIVSAIWKGIQDWAGNIVKGCQVIWDNISGFFSGIWNWLWKAGSDLISGLVNGIVTAAEAIWNFLRAIPGRIGSFFAGIWNWLWKAGSDLISGLVNGIVTAAEAIWNFLRAIPGKIAGFFAGVWNWLWDKGKQLISGLVNGIVTAAEAIWNFLRAIPGKIAGFFANVWNWLFDKGKQLIKGLVNGITGAAEEVWNFIKSIPGKIGGFFADAGKWLLDAGKKIVTGLWDGIKDIWNSVTKWFTDKLKWLKDLWPFSPAKQGPLRGIDWARVGRNWMSDLASGIRDGTPTLEDAALGAAGVVPAIQPPEIAAVGPAMPPPLLQPDLQPVQEATATGIQLWTDYGAGMVAQVTQAATLTTTATDNQAAAINAITQGLVYNTTAQWGQMAQTTGDLSSAMNIATTNQWTGMAATTTAYSEAIKATVGNEAATLIGTLTNQANTLDSTTTNQWTKMASTTTAYSEAIKATVANQAATLIATWTNQANTLDSIQARSEAGLSQRFTALAQTITTTTSSMSQQVVSIWDQMARAVDQISINMVDTIQRTWNYLKNAVGEPVWFVVSKIINPLIKGANLLLDKIGLHVDPIDENTIPRFAQGGRVPGGWGGGDRQLILAEPGEWVLTKGQARALGYENLRRLPHYAEGGPVGPIDWGRSLLGGIVSSFEELAQLGGDVVNEALGLIRWAAAEAFQAGTEPIRKLLKGAQGWPVPPHLVLNAVSKFGETILDKVIEFIQSKSESPLVAGSSEMATAIVEEARRQIGKPYLWGARGPNSFDCSGLIDWCYGTAPGSPSVGWNGPRVGPSGFEQDRLGRVINMNEAMPSDIYFFGNPLHHVGLAIGNGQMIEAPHTGATVRIASPVRAEKTWLRRLIEPTASASNVLPGPGDAVSRWLPVVQAAFGLLGIQPNTDWVSMMLQLIKAESGGNPNAINNWDINAKQGHPSQGLCQVIPSTFAAYHVAGTSNSILDPLANIASSLNYIWKRYGNIMNLAGAKSIMRGGGWIGYDSGGFLPPGASIVVNDTGRPEPVLSPKQWDDLHSAAEGRVELEMVKLLKRIAVGVEQGRSVVIDGREVAKVVDKEMAWVS